MISANASQYSLSNPPSLFSREAMPFIVSTRPRSFSLNVITSRQIVSGRNTKRLIISIVLLLCSLTRMIYPI